MRRLLVAIVLSAGFFAYSQPLQHVEPNPPNSRATLKKPYVVMISLDAFRYDYWKLHPAKNLQQMAKDGVSTPDGMLPSFPSLTFPNHYTLVTGLLPAHHGIVANKMWDAALGRDYDSKTTGQDSAFYGGVPLWSLAEQQGMRSAAMFWPGSMAEVAGKRPTFRFDYDQDYPNEDRVTQIIHWLQLPPRERPHLIALYMPQADLKGHKYGPDSPELAAAVLELDQMIGELRVKLKALHLPVDLIVLADHGMATHQDDWITFDEIPGMKPLLKDVHTQSTLMYGNEEQAAAIWKNFQAHPDPRYTIYRRAEMPERYVMRDAPREGDPVLVANGPYIFRVHASAAKDNIGEHGYDVEKVPEMKAIFFAAGPGIRRNVTLPTFKNVDVYDFVAHLLRLTPAPNDGSLTTFKPVLKN